MRVETCFRRAPRAAAKPLLRENPLARGSGTRVEALFLDAPPEPWKGLLNIVMCVPLAVNGALGGQLLNHAPFACCYDVYFLKSFGASTLGFAEKVCHVRIFVWRVCFWWWAAIA